MLLISESERIAIAFARRMAYYHSDSVSCSFNCFCRTCDALENNTIATNDALTQFGHEPRANFWHEHFLVAATIVSSFNHVAHVLQVSYPSEIASHVVELVCVYVVNFRQTIWIWYERQSNELMHSVRFLRTIFMQPNRPILCFAWAT